MVGGTIFCALSLLLAGNDADRELVEGQRGAVHVDAQLGEVFSWRWRQSLVRTGMFREVNSSFGSPAFSKVYQLVIAGSGEGRIFAFDINDGSLIWQYDHGAPFAGSAAVFNATDDPNGRPDEIAILGSLDGKIVAVETATGRKRWEALLEGQALAPPSQVGRRVLVSTSVNKVFLLDLREGTILWTAQRPNPTSLTISGHARAVESNGLVVAAYSDGYVVAYDTESGSEKWSRPLSIHGGEFVDADADPIISEQIVFVASYSDGIYALDLANGQTLWQRRAPAVVQLSELNDRLIVGSADGFVWALEKLNGELIYRTKMPMAPMSRMLVGATQIVFTAGDVGLVVLDAQSGKPLQATNLGASFMGDPAQHGKYLAVISTFGQIYLLENKSAGRMAQSARDD